VKNSFTDPEFLTCFGLLPATGHVDQGWHSVPCLSVLPICTEYLQSQLPTTPYGQYCTYLPTPWWRLSSAAALVPTIFIAMLIVSRTRSPLAVGVCDAGGLCSPPASVAPATLLIGMPLIDDCPLVGGDGDDAPAVPPLKSPTDDAQSGDLMGDGDRFRIPGDTGSSGDSGDIGDSGECSIESRVEFSACSACTTSAKLMKLRRRGSVVSMAPYDAAASSKSVAAAS